MYRSFQKSHINKERIVSGAKVNLEIDMDGTPICECGRSTVEDKINKIWKCSCGNGYIGPMLVRS